MKCWIYILLVCFIGLSFQPCADTDFVSQTSFSSSSLENTDEDIEHHHGQCNPLCYCSCCGTNVHSLWMLEDLLQDYPIETGKFLSSYSAIFKDLYRSEIWQPPKL